MSGGGQPASSAAAERWRALVTARDAQRGAARRDGDADRDPWRGRADRFAAYSRQLPADDPLLARLRAAVRPGDTVLDVGAGAGRYALPLARLARRVVAVEPSPAMCRALRDGIAAEGVEHVEVVAARWPEAAVAPADVVLCAHVVYGVAAIVPFLRALDAHARRLCLFAIRVDQHPGLIALSRALTGAARTPQPAFAGLYAVLLELGIVADVQIVPSGGFGFADHTAAAAHYRDRLGLPADGPLAARLRDELAARLVRDASGRWRWPGPPPRTAIVSWAPTSDE
ncbi:MAG TPA: methyltransferase domain-containing protein [Thermomicrobiales bacterium]|nr:methyltransferase domain-containing protein [Thermomicrobiales bacterium]